LARLRTFDIAKGDALEDEVDHFEAEKVELLNRSAFANYVLSQREANPTGSFVFRQLDIRDFRSADYAIDIHGNKGADYNLNIIARKLNEKVEQINAVFRDRNIQSEVVPCRYGGDELAIAFIGVEDPQMRTLLYQIIAGDKDAGALDGITSTVGFTKRGNAIKREQTQLKTGLNEIIPPNDPADNELFWNYLRNGVILSHEDMIKVKRNPHDESDHGEPEDLRFDEYIIRLRNRHPELGMSIDALMAIHGSISESDSDGRDKLEKDFREYIDTIVYDRMLGEKVSSFYDLQKHLGADAFSEVYVKDMKGIKEINDYQGIAAGDMAIRQLWESIHSCVPEDEISKVMFFRRGSTFVVGIRKGETLSQEARQQLEALSTVEFEGNEFAIAQYQTDVKKTFSDIQNEKKRLRAVGKFLGKILDGADMQWHSYVIGEIIRKPEIMDAVDMSTREDGSFSAEEAIGLFYNGKRAIERVSSLIRMTDFFPGDVHHQKEWLLGRLLGPRTNTTGDSSTIVNSTQSIIEKTLKDILENKDYDENEKESRRTEVMEREEVLRKEFNWY
jgi:GGDEF domain-containing protein